MSRTTKTLIGGTAMAGLLGGALALYAFAGGDAREHGPGEPHDDAATTARLAGTDPGRIGARGVARPDVVVWKSPTCGCCEGWVDYLEDEGFAVTAHDTDDVDAVKAELGLVDPGLKSCHTATVDGYVVEGHVPVSDIEKLLAERPDVIGLSAPGMPMLSPGMGSIEPKDYDVVSFAADGTVEVFSRH